MTAPLPPSIPPQRVALVGLGLIGGSLAMAWKKHLPDLPIAGCDLEPVLEDARARNLIDAGSTDPRAVVQDADLVMLAVPVGALAAVLQAIAPVLRPGTVVTDVASVKAPVAALAADLLPSSVHYIGGHPMAGAEKGGLAHATPLLFENATYVLCPPENTPGPQHRPLIHLIEAIGARILVLDAERHDRIAATVSHLPQLLAVILMQVASIRNEQDDAFLRLAAGGFRDMTRIASSPFSLWRDILAFNDVPILDALDAFAVALQYARGRLAAGDMDALGAVFDHARTVRDTIPRNTKGFLHPLADIYVYAEDKPGVLSSLTTALRDADLNIKDIELLKVREGTGGAFRLGFAHEQEAQHAAEVLISLGFSAFTM